MSKIIEEQVEEFRNLPLFGREIHAKWLTNALKERERIAKEEVAQACANSIEFTDNVAEEDREETCRVFKEALLKNIKVWSKK